MKKAILAFLLSISLPLMAQTKDPFAAASDQKTLHQQVWALRKMQSRKNKMSAAELAQDRKIRQAMGQKQRQADELDRAAVKAQFLKEHPECATKNPKCVRTTAVKK